MAAPKGNQYAVGNKGGRPRRFTDEELIAIGEDMVATLEEHLRTLPEHKMPIFLSTLARKYNIPKQTLSDYGRQNKVFSDYYERARDLVREILAIGGLKGYFNPTAFIFVAKNETDMKDKQEIDHTTKGEKIYDHSQIIAAAREIANDRAGSEV